MTNYGLCSLITFKNGTTKAIVNVDSRSTKAECKKALAQKLESFKCCTPNRDVAKTAVGIVRIERSYNRREEYYELEGIHGETGFSYDYATKEVTHLFADCVNYIIDLAESQELAEGDDEW